VLSQTQYLLGALVTVAAATALPLVSWGDIEGTVVAKNDRGVYDYGCQAGSTVTGPVAVPVWGACSAPKCWRLLVRDTDGNTWQPCVSRAEYDRTPVGAFWHGRTDE
jgi:hypothetical protein